MRAHNKWNSSEVQPVVPGFRSPEKAVQTLGLEAIANGRNALGREPLLYITGNSIYQEVVVGDTSVVAPVSPELWEQYVREKTAKMEQAVTPNASYSESGDGSSSRNVIDINDYRNNKNNELRKDTDYKTPVKTGKRRKIVTAVGVGVLALLVGGCADHKEHPRGPGVQPPTLDQIAEEIAKKEQENGKYIYSATPDNYDGSVTSASGTRTKFKSQLKSLFYMGDKVPNIVSPDLPINQIRYSPTTHRAFYTDTDGQDQEVPQNVVRTAEFFAANTYSKNPATGTFDVDYTGKIEDIMYLLHKLDDDIVVPNNPEVVSGDANSEPLAVYDPATGRFQFGIVKSNGKTGSLEFEVRSGMGGVTVEENREKYKADADFAARKSAVLGYLTQGVKSDDIKAGNVAKAVKDKNRLYIFLN